MQPSSHPRPQLRHTRTLVLGWIALGLLAFAGSGCVTERNGVPVPRGNQRYPFDTVQERAEKLQKGMTKAQVLLLLGSAAEIDEENDLWIYLPERYAILVPARALRLEFKESVLVDFGYRAIVLGARL